MTATPDLLTLAIVIPLTFKVARRLPAAVRSDKCRPLWAFLFILDAFLAIRISFVRDLVIEVTGMPDAILLVKRILGYAVVAVLVQWVSTVVPGRMDGKREPRYRRIITNRPRRIVTWMLIIGSAALFPLTVRPSGDGEDFLFLQAGHLWGSLHLILFFLYVIFGTLCASTMFSAASRDPKVGSTFKYGMRAMAIGCLFYAAYSILRTGYLVVRLFDKPFLGGDVFVDVASKFALGCFALLMLCGSAAPMWERTSTRIKTHEAVNDLRPMWSILTYAVPSVVYRSRREQWVIQVLAPRAPKLVRAFCKTFRAVSDFWNWHRLDHRLHRRVTEICDAAIRLQSYLPDGLRDEGAETARALGLPGHALPAYLLHTAIHSKKTGFEPRSEHPEDAILKPADDPLATTAMLLPIGKAMTSPVLMGKFHRKHREIV